MKNLAVLLLLVPSLILAQANAQFAPPILPMYNQQMGNIYNGPGLGNQGYQGYAPSILPMMGQQGWNQQGFNQNGWNQQGWNQNGFNQNGFNQQGWNQPGPFGQRPWGPPPPGYGQNNNSGSSMGMMLPLLAMGLGLFSAINGKNRNKGDDWASDDDSSGDDYGNDDSYDDSTDSDNNDADTAAVADAPAACRDCGRGVRRPSATPVRIPQRSDSVDVSSGLQTSSVDTPPANTGNHDDLVAASEEIPVTDPAPTGIVRKPAPKVTAKPRPGVSDPRPDSNPTRTPVVVPVHAGDERAAQTAPIWSPFMRGMSKCAPGCVPVGYSAHRSSGHTCHRTGRALDVFGIKCPGHAAYMAINQGRFSQFVTCMRGQVPKVLYRNHPERNVTEGHRDHAHLSLGCYGGTYW